MSASIARPVGLAGRARRGEVAGSDISLIDRHWLAVGLGKRRLGTGVRRCHVVLALHASAGTLMCRVNLR